MYTLHTLLDYSCILVERRTLYRIQCTEQCTMYIEMSDIVFHFLSPNYKVFITHFLKKVNKINS